MPLLPREVQRQIERKPRPDVVGEEGELYRVEQDLYAKAWQGSHEAGLYRRAPEEPTVLSPYFARKKFWEARLIHDASPVNTLEIVMAYDPRIQRRQTDGTYHFSDSTAAPVTISRAIEPAQHDRADRRRVIIERMYSTLEPLRDQVRTEGKASAAAEQYGAIFAKCEAQLERLLQAPEFRLFQKITSPAIRSLEDLENNFRRQEKAVRKINSRSPILHLLRYGIVPIHPLVNFIPHDMASGRKPKGTFIELVVVHTGRYKEALQQDHPKDFAVRERTVDHYFVLTLLNTLYDHCTDLSTDPNRSIVREGLFQVTERLRRIAAQQGMAVFVQLEQRVEQQLLSFLVTRPSPAAVQENFRNLDHRLQDFSR